MFLVEREPGNVAVYNSTAELSQAIREGAIGPTARIYHRRSSQWLPITEHPSYRQAKAEAELPPLPPLRRRHWTFLPSAPSSASETRAGHRAPSEGAGQPDETTATTGTAREGAETKTSRTWWPISLRRRRSRGSGEPS